MNNLRIFSPVWGSYVDWFEKGTLQSLKWPNNFAEVQNADWHFLSRQADIERLVKLIEPFKPKSVEINDIGEDKDFTIPILLGLIEEIKRNVESGNPSLLAPPDIIFSEGSVATLKYLGRPRDLNVMAAHVRVNPTFLNEMNDTPMSSSRMVSLAMEKHLHQSWVLSELSSPETCSFQGGVTWSRIPGMANYYEVTHLLPAPFHCKFIPSDISFFMRQDKYGYGAIDHLWPSRLLKNRQHIIGSSDAAFLVEITDPTGNMPVILNNVPLDPLGFWKEHMHNEVNRNFKIIFRGE